MMKNMRPGCCNGCGSRGCGGACKKTSQYIARDDWPREVKTVNEEEKPSGPCEVDVALKLPTPKLPDHLTIELCDDCGEWRRFTLPTNIASLLLGSSYARMASAGSIAQPEPSGYEALLEILRA